MLSEGDFCALSGSAITTIVGHILLFFCKNYPYLQHWKLIEGRD